MLLVVEPTVSGVHDLERALTLVGHFGMPAVIAINKYDLNEANTAQIETQCSLRGVEIAGKMPFDNIVTESIVRGIPVVEHSNGEVARAIGELWRNLANVLGTGAH